MQTINKDDIIIRPARANDAKAVAPLIFSAGIELNTYLFATKNTQPLHIIEKAFAENAGLSGYANHWVAEIAGKVLGVGAFYTGKQKSWLDIRLGLWLLKRMPYSEKISCLCKATEVARLFSPLPKNMLYTANLGVSPKARGYGVGSKLIHFQQERANQLGLTYFGLDVAVTNPAAQRLYERLGMVQQWEKAFTGKATAGIPNMRRMRMLVTDITE